ncbi:feruloyl esterase B [Colletotrichum salicis]|uniref:Carboxylic ester hydrolase n=1 Tax=Colletotrichum salicis TaxID=1209931 RepID=A0A135V954_9PEZI|nr:feruloyl esterase B [Colletotrichum salicis]
MDPYACNFRPEAMLCTRSNNNASTCLTLSLIGTLRHPISDYVDANQTFIFPGPSLGSSLGFVASGTEKPSAIGLQYIINMVMNDTNWNWRSFSYETVQTIDRIDPGNSTADNYDLAPFKDSGASIYFYEEVYKTMGVNLDDCYRMFLVPGLFHCTGSTEAPWFTGISTITRATHGVPGHNDADHNGVLAIMRWVEESIAPEKIVATNYNSDNALKGVARQQPVCPYPTKARYMAGDLDMPISWNCT